MSKNLPVFQNLDNAKTESHCPVRSRQQRAVCEAREKIDNWMRLRHNFVGESEDLPMTTNEPVQAQNIVEDKGFRF